MGHKTYAVHGRFDLLEAVVEHLKELERGEYKIVFLGDYVDRGPQSREVIEYLMKGPDDRAEWHCLKGNHEHMLVAAQVHREPELVDFWIRNGGSATLDSYGHQPVPDPQLEWMDKLPLIYQDDYRLYVHAWVDSQLELRSHDPRDLMWKRYPPKDPGGHRGLYVVHGHTPSVKGPELFEQRIALDTLAWKTGRIVIAVFDDERPGRPYSTIEISGF
jgi:serine/threonine protein phosphatase 1